MSGLAITTEKGEDYPDWILKISFYLPPGQVLGLLGAPAADHLARLLLAL